ncbi:MAG: hypothetical protein FJY29_06265 [Betaproteobacteria bacterium]|nr:hypothetical protein [Betaproteobacteria bacterium]
MTTHSSFENPVGKTSDGVSTESGVVQKWQRELDAIDALGLKSQPWKISDANESVVLPHLDIDWLISQPLLPYLVQALPTQLLQRSLQAHGLEDSLEVIETIRGEALVRLMDYELWAVPGAGDKFLSPDEDLSAERFIQWVKLWNEISPDFAAERLLELDEEVIIGSLTAACEIIPVGLNRMQEELSDDYWMTPDNKFGLKIKTTNEADFEIVHGLVHSLYRKDVRLAQKVLSYSAMLIRDESLEEARRWRQGRLEDQGYVPSDEARSLLLPRTQKRLSDMVKLALRREQSLQDQSKPGATVLNTAPAVQVTDEETLEKLRSMVNSLDADHLSEEIRSIMPEDDLIRLIGTAQMQPEQLVQDEHVIESFVEKLSSDINTLLVRLEAHNAKQLKVNAKRTKLLFDFAMAEIAEHEPALALSWKTRLARTTNAASAALGAANDSNELGRVLSVVRGCLNIGLEKLLSEPKSFGLDFDAVNFSTDEAEDITPSAVALVRSIGPETLFQVGWQSLQELAKVALEMVVESAEIAGKKQDGCEPEYTITLAEGQTLKLPVLDLLKAGRYREVRKWLRDTLEENAALEHVLLSTVNRLPVFPIILLEENGVTRGKTDVKPYETLQETEITKGFLARLKSLVGRPGQEE